MSISEVFTVIFKVSSNEIQVGRNLPIKSWLVIPIDNFPGSAQHGVWKPALQPSDSE